MTENKNKMEVFFDKLENYGEEKVRDMIAEGSIASSIIPWANEWLNKKDRERQSKSEARKEGREEKSLQLAADANSLSKKSILVAIFALIIAGISLYVSSRK